MEEDRPRTDRGASVNLNCITRVGSPRRTVGKAMKGLTDKTTFDYLMISMYFRFHWHLLATRKQNRLTHKMDRFKSIYFDETLHIGVYILNTFDNVNHWRLNDCETIPPVAAKLSPSPAAIWVVFKVKFKTSYLFKCEKLTRDLSP